MPFMFDWKGEHWQEFSVQLRLESTDFIHLL